MQQDKHRHGRIDSSHGPGPVEEGEGEAELEHECRKRGARLLAIWRVGKIFLEWAICLRHDEMVAVGSTRVRNYRNVGGHFKELSHAAQPSDVRLDIEKSALNELSETASGVFMLSGRELELGVGSLDLPVSLGFIWREALLEGDSTIDIVGLCDILKATQTYSLDHPSSQNDVLRWSSHGKIGCSCHSSSGIIVFQLQPL
jgi:hypothetical protein